MRARPRSFTKDEDDRIRAMYEGGAGMREIGRMLGRPIGSIWTRMRRVGIKTRSVSEGRRATWERFSSIKYGFFEEWSRELAYFLGWAWTDGNVRWFGGTCTFDMGLQDSDRDRVEYLAGLTGAHIYRREAAPEKKRVSAVARMVFSSIRVGDFFKQVGLEPRKSMTIGPPIGIPQELMRDFFRGAIEGDGYVRWMKRKCLHIEIVSGSERFIRWFLETARRCAGVVKGTVRVARGRYWIAAFYLNDAKRLRDWMYEGTPEQMILRRKWATAYGESR
jgi:hypothetical protein